MNKKIPNENQLIIVDVGASGGVHQRWLKFGPVVKSILFEPDREAFQKLISNEPKNSLIINAALADSPKVVDFNICKWQEVSSIYKPNFNLLEKFEDSERFKIKNVSSLKADSLNNLLKKEKVYDIDFIKIDTQGSELDILKGASNHFQNLIGMEVEVEFVELYHDQPLFNEVNSFIESKGFNLIDIRRTYWKRKGKVYPGNKGQLIFGDALYLRSPEEIIELGKVNKEKIIRSIYVYLAYGYDDLAKTLFDLAKKHKLFIKEIEDGIREILMDYKTPYILPNFRGKERVKNIVDYLGSKFKTKSFSSGTDSKLGN